MIIGGADCVQVVSTLYKNKIAYLEVMLKELNDWMDSKNYKKLSDFKGKLSQKKVNDPYIYKRAQYIDILLKTSDLFKKYQVH
jgi:dihydroorotate dehydrogenase (fumarate)